MKLQNKIFLMMGGCALVSVALVITIAVLQLSGLMRSISEESHAYAYKALQTQAIAEARSFKQFSDEVYERVSSFSSAMDSPRNEMLRAAARRLDFSTGAALQLIAEYTISDTEEHTVDFRFIQAKSCNPQKKPKATLLDDPIKNCPVLLNPKFQSFLRAVRKRGDSLTRFLVADNQCWIAQVFVRDEYSVVYAVQVRPDALNGTVQGAESSTGYILASGSTPMISELASLRKQPAPEMLDGLYGSLLQESQSANVVTRVLPDTDSRNFWFVCGIRIQVPFFESDHVTLLRFFEFKNVLPNLTHDVDVRVERLMALIISVSVLSLFLLVIPMILIARQISRPLTRAVQFANSLANNEFTLRILSSGGIQEIETLTRALNHLRDKLNATITKLKRSHEREQEARLDAESSNTVKSDFLSCMSAELRDPINAVNGFLAILSKEIAHKDSIPVDLIKPPIHEIHSAMKRIESVTHPLQALSSLDLEAHVHNSDFDLFELLQEAQTSSALERQKRNVLFEFRSSADLPQTMHSDREKLLYLLTLLFSSLIKETPPQSSLIFAASLEAGQIVFRIFGDPRNQVPLDFSIYDSSPRASGKKNIPAPSVVHLTLVKHLTHRIGGTFQVVCKDRQEYKIELSFPKSDPLPASPSETGTFHRASNWSVSAELTPLKHSRSDLLDSISNAKKHANFAPKILLAEDDVSNRALVDMILRDTASEIVHAESFDDCASLIAAHNCNLLIVNIRMHNQSHFGGICKLRELFPQEKLFIIALAPFLEEGDRERLISAGANRCVLKPIRFDELIDAVRSASCS